jgi:glycosyltransferase involved in cell wall biosynthesis
MLNQFISSSTYSEQVRQFIAAKNISDRVIPLESRHGEIADAMCASDVVVLPSKPTKKWVEQFGRVVPEAMSCGNVAVVSDSGAPKELIGPSGLVFRAGDADHLAAILRQLIFDPSECRKRRRLAIRQVRDKLSTDVQADLMLAVIGRLTARRRPISHR